MAAKKPKAAEPAPAEAPAVMERLLASAQAARENNATDEFMDGDNRRWFVGTENVGNHSHVLIQAQKGQDVRQAYVSTATFTPDRVERAILDIHGALL